MQNALLVKIFVVFRMTEEYYMERMFVCVVLNILRYIVVFRNVGQWDKDVKGLFCLGVVGFFLQYF